MFFKDFFPEPLLFLIYINDSTQTSYSEVPKTLN